MSVPKRPRPIVQFFSITLAYGKDSYAVIPLDTDRRLAKKSFQLRKQTGDRMVYEVHLTDHGPECECKGFLYRHKCKHIRMLNAARMLD